MALTLRIHLLSPIIPTGRQPQYPFPSTTTTTTLFSNRPRRIKISCTKKNGDAELASALASEVARINTHILQKEEAMKKSKELLFTEVCQYLGLKVVEVKKKWRKIGEEEKRVLVEGFVSEWSANFHPLSARSVKEMVDEYLQEQEQEQEQEQNPSAKSSTSVLFPGLKRIMGF